MDFWQSKFKCAHCGAEFDEPHENTWREDMNGDGWAFAVFTEFYCPECGSDEIESAEDEDEEDAETNSL